MIDNLNTAEPEIVCKVLNVSKFYPGVAALKSVSFDIRKGEIHGVIGKNGAGKSTIVNILAGLTPLTSGEIWIKGTKTPKNYNPRMAENLSVYLVTQNPLILPQRSITENLFIGYILHNGSGFIAEDKMRSITEEIIKKFGFQLNPDQEMGTLPIDTQKLLLLGRGIYIAKADILMLDEITASLNVEGRKKVDVVIREVIAEGKSIVFISHHLKEVINYCDRVTVFRNGSKVTTAGGKTLTEESLTKLIIGSDLSKNNYLISEFKRRDPNPMLNVSNFNIMGCCHNISFDLYRNEVLGFIGLEGCGKEELFETIFGIRNIDSGSISINGERILYKSPESAIAKGIIYLSRNREDETVFHMLSIQDNMVQMVYKKLKTKMGFIDVQKIREFTDSSIKLLNIKQSNVNDDIDSLSGGNKQKVMLSRIIGMKPKVFILNEPTQGIDVETKEEILKIVREKLVEESSVIISSESVQELMSVCDRIIVLYKGMIRCVFEKEAFSEDEIYLKVQGA